MTNNKRPKPSPKGNTNRPGAPRASRHTQNLLTTGFPRMTTVKLKYVTDILLTPVTGAMASHIFSANSIYDPDVTGVGHQPLGHDQWEPFYNSYIVTDSVISIRANTTLTTASNVTFAIALIDSPFPNADPSTYLEQAVVSQRTVTGHVGAQTSVALSQRYNVRKTQRVVNPNDTMAYYGAGFNANPGNQTYFAVSCCAVDTTFLTPSPATMRVQIEYTVQFADPKELIKS